MRQIGRGPVLDLAELILIFEDILLVGICEDLGDICEVVMRVSLDTREHTTHIVPLSNSGPGVL